MSDPTYPEPWEYPPTDDPPFATPYGLYNPVGQFAPFQSTYCNHMAVCFHPVNWTAYILQTWRLNGSGPFSLQVYSHTPPYDNYPQLLRAWKQTVDVPGPFGYGDLKCMPDGSLYIAIPGGVQQENKIQPSVRIEPGVCAPFAPGGWASAGAGGISGSVLFDAPLTSPQWDGRQMPADTGVAVDVPATFGAPSSPGYIIRFIAVADAPNVRVRAGRPGGAPHFLTLNTHVAGLEEHSQGHAPGPSLYVSTVNGSAKVWLQIVGLA